MNKFKKYKIISIILLLIIISTINIGVIGKKEIIYKELQKKPEWTLMFYFATNNKLYKPSEKYIEELIDIGSSEDLNLIYLFDGPKNNDTKLCFINNQSKSIEIGKDLGWPTEVNTGEINTLDLFCKQTIEQFPANRYGLFIITVGVGWQGVCADFQTYPDFKIITINELGKMLSRLTNNGESKIDILSIVACLESMIEVAIEIESYIEYFIASEADNTALQVWPNLSSIKKIKNNTNISSENFVKDIVQNQNTYNINLKPKIFDILLKNRIFKILNFVTIHTSLSAINLSKIEILKNKINNLSQLLILNIKENNVIESIKKARKEVREYGKWSPKYHILYKPKFCPLYDLLPLEQFAFDCYIDLYDFVNILKENVENNFIKISCEDVMNNINETVFSIAKTKNDTQTHGLSVYFPEKSKQFNQFLFPGKLPCLYENLKFSIETKWDEFIKTYLNI